MRTLGVIAEYNPFHNGHMLHLQTAKRELNADYCVVVMSGNFVQRGEPAIIHKWKRAEMCLLNGADLVIELPVYYATASAEYFAWGAVKLLDSTNIVDYLSFGTESGSIADFEKTLEYVVNEPPEYKLLLKHTLSEGNSFPKARAKALSLASSSKDIYETPNNILALEYLKALKNLKSEIIPHTIKRNTNHNSDMAENGFSSASAIRKAILNGRLKDIKPYVPLETHAILESDFPICFNDYSDILVCKIKTAEPDNLRRILDVSEGLERRIIAAAENTTIDSIISQIKTKRYTFTKIQRILTHILLNITKTDMDSFRQNGGPSYIRVLGFRRTAEPLLRRLTESASLPVVTNLKKNMSKLDELSRNMILKEIYSTDIYFIKHPQQTLRRKGIEYSLPLLIV